MHVKELWRPKDPGRHWKLMTVVLVAFTGLSMVLMCSGAHLAGVAVFVGVLTLLVQWVCIEPPGVRDEDLHGTQRPPAGRAPPH
jgi:hypothetical protein